MKKFYSILSTCFISVLLFGCSSDDTIILYGNDYDAIEKAVTSLIESEDLVIFDYVDVEDERIVLFLDNDRPGMVTVTKDSEGNYLINEDLYVSEEELSGIYSLEIPYENESKKVTITLTPDQSLNVLWDSENNTNLNYK